MLWVTALCVASPCMAQTKADGIDLVKDALKLHKNPRTNDDLVAAKKKYERALGIFETVGFHKGRAQCAYNLGIIYTRWGEYERAVEYYHMSLDIRRKLGDLSGEGRSFLSLGRVYSIKTDYRKALECYEKALHIFKKVRDLRRQAIVLNLIGSIHQEQGRYEAALACYREALDRAERTGNGSAKALSLNNLGRIHSARSEYHKAEEYYEKALGIAGEAGDLRGQATALNNLGLLFLTWTQYEKAVECFHKAVAIRRKLVDVRGEGSVVNNLGEAYRRQSRYPEAVKQFEKWLNIAEKMGDLKGQTTALTNLGLTYEHWGEYDRAVENYRKSLNIARSTQRPLSEATALVNLGNVCVFRAQYAEAQRHYADALSIAEKLGNAKVEGTALNNLGAVYRRLGDYAKAVKHYEKALATAERIGSPKAQAVALNNLGTLYRHWGQYTRAAEFHRKALELRKNMHDLKAEANSLLSIARVCMNVGAYETAVGYCEKALSVHKRLGYAKGEAAILAVLGDIRAAQGHHVDALVNYREALAIRNRIGISAGSIKDALGNLYLDMEQPDKATPFLEEAGRDASLGRLYLLTSNYVRAKDHFHRLLESAGRNRDANDLFIACTGLGLVYEAMGDDANAAEYFRKAVRHTEELRSSLTPDQRRNFFDVRIRGFSRIAPYEGLARVYMKLNRPVDAWKCSEFTRARVFSESMSGRFDGARYDVPAKVLRQDAAIHERIAALRKQLRKAYERNNTQVVEALQPQLRELEHTLVSHITVLRENHPLFAATRYPEPMDLSQTALNDSEWVLSYDVTDSATIVYLTHGRKLVKALAKPVSRREVDALVQRFREPFETTSERSLVEKLAAFDFEAGRKLAQILVKGMLADLPKGTPLIIVPDDCLGVLPFETLVLSKGGTVVTRDKIPCTSGAEFFGDRNPLSYYQSVTALTLARTFEWTRSSATRLLVMDDPIFDPRDERLRSVSKQDGMRMTLWLEEQLMSLRRDIGPAFPRLSLTALLGTYLERLDPERTDRYSGIEAGKQVLFARPLTQYRAMVFATHGYFGKDLPGIQEPVLVLTLLGQPAGKDGFLRMTEVMGLKMHADTVVLTACQTGLGRRISGEGTMGMGRAFQYAGAKSVIMSLWSVAETSSIKLTEAYFKHLHQGKSRSEALRLARSHIREQGYDHPFFWAPFILVGEVD